MNGVAPAQRVLITGASRGIGRALAGFLAESMDVALLATNAAGLEAVRAEIVAAHPNARVVTVTADVTDPDQVAAAVARVEAELGGIDLLINNAGRIDAEVRLWEADPDQWWDVMATNVKGPFLLSRAVIPGMLARGGGRIININSGSGTRDFDVATAYTASKTALFRIGGAIHLAGFEQGLRAFELAPGVVHTDMTAGMQLHEGRTEWTSPEDVAALVQAIARGEADHLSGGYLRVGLDAPGDLHRRTFSRRLGLTAEAATLAPQLDGTGSVDLGPTIDLPPDNLDNNGAMKVLVVVASVHGSTKEIGSVITEELVQLGFDAKQVEPGEVESLDGVDAVVLGSAVYMAQWTEVARGFAARFMKDLRGLPLWAFSVGLSGVPKDHTQDPRRVGEALIALSPIDHQNFKGRLDFALLSLRERSVARLGNAAEGDYRDWARIREWARGIGRDLKEHVSA